MKGNLNTIWLRSWRRSWIAAIVWAGGFWLMTPGIARGQSVGKVECPRSEGYVYLYSDMSSLDVRTTLQCGEQVEITGRYDKYFGVRTSKGDVGYLPITALFLIKDKVGPNAAQPTAPKAARPRIAYDPTPAQPAGPPPADASKLTLPNGLPIRMKLSKAVSTATAHEGDQVESEAMEDEVLEGLCVIRKGAQGTGTVMESEQKKRMGHDAKLGVLVNSVRLSDNEKAPVRSYQDASGATGTAGSAMPMASGKDIIFPQGMEFKAFVDGDVQLKREAFQAVKEGAGAATSAAQSPSQPR